MFGKAQGQKENPILSKPSQTLRGCAIFDRRICETGNWELGTGNGRVALLRDREERGMGRFAAVAQERDPPKPNQKPN